MAFIAAFLFAFDMIITMMACGGSWFVANASISTSSLGSMKARAEDIINYKWTPSRNIYTWNNSDYNGSKIFRKGVKVKGVPFCLFTDEVVSNSLVSLSKYKTLASKNYSVTAKCRSTHNSWRTGPVYGSCCASFVSEVLGGSFLRYGSPRYIGVSSIASSPYATHISYAKITKVKVGDSLNKSSHIIWIGDITDKYYVIYEQTPPVARKVLVPKEEAISPSGYFQYRGCAYTTINRVKVTNTALSISAPSASATCDYYAENAQAEINWNYQTYVSYYLVDVFKDGELVVDGEAVTDNSYTVNKGNGTYEVKVTAVCGSTQKVSNTVTFSIGKLDAPIISTKQKYYATGDSITVDWNPCVGATEYHVTAVKDGETQYLDETVDTSSYTFAPEDGYYEFRVDSVNTNGGYQTASSRVNGFNVGNKRPVIIDTSVTYFVHDASVDIKWNDCEGVSDYSLHITKDGANYLSRDFTGCVPFATGALEDGYYEAIVTPGESRGEYDWQPSEPYGFYIGKLDKPVVTPENDFVPCHSKATVNWEPCDGAVSYRIAVTSQDEAVYQEDLSGTSCTFDVEEGMYTVQVTAINTNGGYQECASDPADLWAVSVDIDKPSQTLFPGESVVFSTVVSGVDSGYDVEWSTSNSDVATVSPAGKVTAVGLGTAEVTAKICEITVSRTISVMPDLSYEMLGASIRLTQPYGIRFGVRLEKDEAFRSTEIVEYGTLIIGSGNLGSNELTLDTPDALRIEAENFLEETAGHITYTGVLVNIPESFFHTDVVGRGYLKYRGVDGEVYTLYTSSVVKSFNGVAQSAYNNYLKLENPSRLQQESINKLKEILGLTAPADDSQPDAEEETNEISGREESPVSEDTPATEEDSQPVDPPEGE